MAKQNLLVVDADERSLCVLEVSLRNAGYNVAGCPSAGKALEILHVNKPDLILADTQLPDLNGFELIEQIRGNPSWSNIPFMFLSSDGSIESKIRGLELGVEDYLTKPIYIREVVARVGIELSRNRRNGLARGSGEAKTRFSGSLDEMSIVDLLQTADVSRKSGMLHLVSDEDERGIVLFDEGSIVHAEVGERVGESAVHRLLVWRTGTFDFEFRPVREETRTIDRPTQAILIEGMRYFDERSRLIEQLPSLDDALEVDEELLYEGLRDTPDDHNAVLRLIDGERSVADVLREHGGDELDVLKKIVSLYFEGLVRVVGQSRSSVPVVVEQSRHSRDTIPGPNAEEIAEAYPSVPPAPAVARSERLRAVTPSGFQAVTAAPPPSEPVPSDPAILGAWRAKSTPPESGNGGTMLNWGGRASARAPSSVAASASVAAMSSTAASAPSSRKPVIGRIAGIGQLRSSATPVRQEPEIAQSLLQQSPRALEVNEWDSTLDELKDDPEVSEAIAIIDSTPPPAPFVRSTPPLYREIDVAVGRGEGEMAGTSSASSGAWHVELAPALQPAALMEQSRVEASEDDAADLESILPKRRQPWLLVLAAVALVAGAWFYLTRSNETSEAELPAHAARSVFPTELVVTTLPDEVTHGPAAASPTTDAPSASATDTYEGLLARARKLKGSQAIEAYRGAIALDPNASDALAELAMLLLNEDQPAEAEQLAGRALTVDPTSSRAWITLGAARQHARDQEGADAAYRNCVTLGRGPFVEECRSMLR